MSSCCESSFRTAGAETRIRAKADNCRRNASWSKKRPASCGTSIVTVNAAISFAFLYNIAEAQLLSVGSFGISRLLSSPVTVRFFLVPGRVHSLPRKTASFYHSRRGRDNLQMHAPPPSSRETPSCRPSGASGPSRRLQQKPTRTTSSRHECRNNGRPHWELSLPSR